MRKTSNITWRLHQRHIKYSTIQNSRKWMDSRCYLPHF